MSRPVYSVCFVSLTVPAVNEVYPIPSGDTLIVNHMSYYSPSEHSTHEGDLALSVAADDSVAFIWWLSGGALTKGVYPWSGREVCTSFLEVTNVVPNATIRICGLLLTAT